MHELEEATEPGAEASEDFTPHDDASDVDKAAEDRRKRKNV